MKLITGVDVLTVKLTLTNIYTVITPRQNIRLPQAWFVRRPQVTLQLTRQKRTRDFFNKRMFNLFIVKKPDLIIYSSVYKTKENLRLF